MLFYGKMFKAVKTKLPKPVGFGSFVLLGGGTSLLAVGSVYPFDYVYGFSALIAGNIFAIFSINNFDECCKLLCMFIMPGCGRVTA